MSLSSFAIARPVTTLMIFVSMCLFGVIALTRLPVELYPDVSYGQISIIVYIRGGIPPTEVESMVTLLVEESVATVSHLKGLLSISKEGESTVVLTFDQGSNMEIAAMEVREKFAKVKDKMPKEAEKPVIAQFSESDAPIVILAITSLKKTQEEIRKVVEEDIKPTLKRVKGVANVEVGGGRERKILIEVDKNMLSRYGVSVNQIINVLGSNNLDILIGEFERKTDKVLLRAKGQINAIEEVKNMAVITKPEGSIVRVKDFAEVKDSYGEVNTYSRINLSPVVSMYVQKESKGNTISCSEEILREIEALKKTIPKDIKIKVTKNQAEFIRKSINDLKDSLLRGSMMILFILVLFMSKWENKYAIILPAGIIAAGFAPARLMLFLLALTVLTVLFNKKYRPILIVAVSIPISLIITFGVMDMCNMLSPGMNMSINFMTLFGLALGVGMLVDNAIVVYENIATKAEMGVDKVTAAIEGSTEMNVVIFASTLTAVIVFLPMLFISKSMSILYGGVAWTVTFSLTVSLFVSLMVVPLMCARSKSGGEASGEELAKSKILLPLYRIQKKYLLYVFRRRFAFIGFGIMIPYITSALIWGQLGQEYLGSTEQNRFTIFIELPTGAKLDASDEVVRKVEDMAKEIPEVKDFTSRVEAWSSKVYVNLVGLDKRTRSIAEIIDSLRPKVARLSPAFVYFEEEQEVGTKEITLNIFGFSYDILREIAIAVTTRMGRSPYFKDAKIRMREGRPELWLRVDKLKSAKLGYTTKDIGDLVHAQVRGVRATMLHDKGSEVENILRLAEKDRRTIKDMHLLPLSKRGDDKVLMDQAAQFEYGLGPSEIWRKDRARMIQVSASLAEIPLDKAVKILDKELSDLKLPEDYYYEVGGDYENMVQSQRETNLTLIIILFLVYLVMAAIFESFSKPFMIIVITVPLACAGALLGLYFTKTAVGMGARIGLMMLGGIVVNNGIILIDHANVMKKHFKNPFRMLIRVGNDRLRAVLMTKSATIFGLLPMAIDKSEGSNLWNPLAITVISGLVFATPITLVLLPAIYSVFDDFPKLIKSLNRENIGKWLTSLAKAVVAVPLAIAGFIFRKKRKKNKPADKGEEDDEDEEDDEYDLEEDVKDLIDDIDDPKFTDDQGREGDS